MNTSIQSALISVSRQLRKLEIQVAVVNLIRSLLQEWRMEFNDINPKSRLTSDLNFESIEIINLVVALEKKYRKTLDYSRLLMQDGHYVEDISIEQLANFVGESFPEDQDECSTS
ncbi:MAG: hypothetical protein ACRC8A_19000 [Microcoleaceae cyanobacterium]